jgi:hypothetical protein
MVAEAIQASSLNRQDLITGAEWERLILADRIVKVASQGRSALKKNIILGREEVQTPFPGL